MTILDQIVASKRKEIIQWYTTYQLDALRLACQPEQKSTPEFYQRLGQAKASGQPFFIAEFKRKSPSEGWIHQNADLPAQIRAYASAGASAISVLTDGPYFGGSYEDLKAARAVLDTIPHPPLLLQKEFILDPLQIYLARLAGADLILLIAAILSPEELESLRLTAESIGLGVLVEVHDAEELAQIQHLSFPVLGVNNRDLKTFRTALNRVNTLKEQAEGRYIIAESGILDHRHFQMVRRADGFLIGTGLMKPGTTLATSFTEHFQHEGKWLFKACGIRTEPLLTNHSANWLGINFSHRSKRRLSPEALAAMNPVDFSRLVAVFYHNTFDEIEAILARFPFKTIQLYAGDLSPDRVRQLKARVLMAIKTPPEQTPESILETMVEPYAADVDCFILDSATPGAGARIKSELPAQFPYPFLLAGGLHEDNLNLATHYPNCIGVDIASGIETDGVVDFEKIRRIGERLASLPLPHDFSDCF
ncbi:MAG TPA: bifunctional indole-3-glycerol phosphate synthase/phosphoribosylanthranilate isomerase [Saprospiraceae bacterium]|nr:bifunctional indole-3-glycerol phosphate synthase/phosphoribosylanthranilate isomerase [Saprospiraceae bacterium]